MHPRALIGVQLNRRVPGAVVESVIDGLPAKEAGLRAGDIILKLNGQSIGEADELTKKLREFREGQGVTLRVKRLDSEFDLSVNLRLPNLGEAGRGLERADRMNRMGSTPSPSTRHGSSKLAMWRTAGEPGWSGRWTQHRARRPGGFLRIAHRFGANHPWQSSSPS
jgi:membrane-associated protease RseP (regulator of RpoE activity)